MNELVTYTLNIIDAFNKYIHSTYMEWYKIYIQVNQGVILT